MGRRLNRYFPNKGAVLRKSQGERSRIIGFPCRCAGLDEAADTAIRKMLSLSNASAMSLGAERIEEACGDSLEVIFEGELFSQKETTNCRRYEAGVGFIAAAIYFFIDWLGFLSQPEITKQHYRATRQSKCCGFRYDSVERNGIRRCNVSATCDRCEYIVHCLAC